MFYEDSCEDAIKDFANNILFDYVKQAKSFIAKIESSKSVDQQLISCVNLSHLIGGLTVIAQILDIESVNEDLDFADSIASFIKELNSEFLQSLRKALNSGGISKIQGIQSHWGNWDIPDFPEIN